jgi:hypothetical protein
MLVFQNNKLGFTNRVPVVRYARRITSRDNGGGIRLKESLVERLVQPI